MMYLASPEMMLGAAMQEVETEVKMEMTGGTFHNFMQIFYADKGRTNVIQKF